MNGQVRIGKLVKYMYKVKIYDGLKTPGVKYWYSLSVRNPIVNTKQLLLEFSTFYRNTEVYSHALQ